MMVWCGWWGEVRGEERRDGDRRLECGRLGGHWLLDRLGLKVGGWMGGLSRWEAGWVNRWTNWMER